ncbi:MAG: hypothetical protein AB7L65_03900 [Hyphomonadaceae bacterium]
MLHGRDASVAKARRALVAAALLACAVACHREAPPAAEDQADAQTDAAAIEAAQAREQLAALGGPANAAQRALYEGEFEASGALDSVGSGEGAWELQILNDYIQFVRPGLGQDGGLPGPRDFHEKGMQVEAGPLIITLKAEACALPNGVNLAYSAHVLFEGVAYQGCAKRGVDQGNRASWASVLPDLIPAIDACLARAHAPPTRVTIASMLDDDIVSVRLRESDGGREECLASANGANVTAFDPISDLDRRNGEGDPEFQRASGPEPRAQQCHSVEPVRSAQGGLLGWLIRRTC